MNLYPGSIFHIYNRGNNKQPIFFSRDNYMYFLNKVRQHLSDYCDFLSYCLMPTHFHFMVNTPDNFDGHGFSERFRVMLSSYARGINKQENRSGSLFQQNTHSVDLIRRHENHAIACFHYIHQNPLRAELVTKMEDWEFSFPLSVLMMAGIREILIISTPCLEIIQHGASIARRSELKGKSRIRYIDSLFSEGCRYRIFIENFC